MRRVATTADCLKTAYSISRLPSEFYLGQHISPFPLPAPTIRHGQMCMCGWDLRVAVGHEFNSAVSAFVRCNVWG
jgi:hypothetical protein